MSWRKHRVDIKIKISNAVKTLYLISSCNLEMKLEVLIVCKVPELYIHIVSKFT